MKNRILIWIAAFGLTSSLAIPGWAQRGGHGRGMSMSKSPAAISRPATRASQPSKAQARSNRGGKVRGRQRAEEVQTMNTRADANRGFTVAPGLQKSERHATSKNAKRSKRAHVRKAKKHGPGNGQGEDRDRGSRGN